MTLKELGSSKAYDEISVITIDGISISNLPFEKITHLPIRYYKRIGISEEVISELKSIADKLNLTFEE